MLINKWKFVVIFGALALVMAAILSSYMKGRTDGKAVIEAKYLKEQQEWIQKVAAAQNAHVKRVNEITEEYTKKISSLNFEIKKLKQNPVIVEKIIQQYIPENHVCDINKGFVDLHNRSAEGSSLDAPVINPNEKTDITLGQVGRTVAENYYSCNAEFEKIKALQQIILEFQKAQEELK
jgi:hypothetical protein